MDTNVDLIHEPRPRGVQGKRAFAGLLLAGAMLLTSCDTDLGRVGAGIVDAVDRLVPRDGLAFALCPQEGLQGACHLAGASVADGAVKWDSRDLPGAIMTTGKLRSLLAICRHPTAILLYSEPHFRGRLRPEHCVPGETLTVDRISDMYLVANGWRAPVEGENLRVRSVIFTSDDYVNGDEPDLPRPPPNLAIPLHGHTASFRDQIVRGLENDPTIWDVSNATIDVYWTTFTNMVSQKRVGLPELPGDAHETFGAYCKLIRWKIKTQTTDESEVTDCAGPGALLSQVNGASVGMGDRGYDIETGDWRSTNMLVVSLFANIQPGGLLPIPEELGPAPLLWPYKFGARLEWFLRPHVGSDEALVFEAWGHHLAVETGNLDLPVLAELLISNALSKALFDGLRGSMAKSGAEIGDGILQKIKREVYFEATNDPDPPRPTAVNAGSVVVTGLERLGWTIHKSVSCGPRGLGGYTCDHRSVAPTLVLYRK